MPTAKPIKTDVNTQTSVQYKANLDANSNVDARLSWAFAPHAQDTPNMTVALAAGAILSGTTLTEVAAQSTTTITAPVTNPRIDRVVIDSVTGAVSVVEGDEAAEPEAPAIPAGKLPVARVLLATDTTAITNADLTDERVGGSGGVQIGSIADPSAEEAASTLDVATAIAAIPTADAFARDMALYEAFRNWRQDSKSSGPIPSGYLWTFQSDELATKTNATYDASGKQYTNQSIISVTSGASAVGTFGSSCTTVDKGITACPNGSTITVIGCYCASSASLAVKVLKFVSGSTWNVVHSESFSHPGGGYADKTLSTPYAVPNDGKTYRIGIYGPSSTTSYASGSADLYYGDATGNGVAFVLNDNRPFMSRYTYRSGAQSITLKPTAITVGAAPASALIDILHAPTDAVTLNTDLKARVSFDGGSTWSGYVTLEQVCEFSSGVYLLKGLVDTTGMTPGTSVLWEITTDNAKAQAARGVALVLS
ncbi:MAG: hypothetical protein KKF77_03495 [Proteobacteria bacterium]|nr:hypothetical protein [Pseudomonadota bacterium]